MFRWLKLSWLKVLLVAAVLSHRIVRVNFEATSTWLSGDIVDEATEQLAELRAVRKELRTAMASNGDKEA